MEKEYCKDCKKYLDTEDDLEVSVYNNSTFWYCKYCDKTIRSVNNKTGITTYY